MTSGPDERRRLVDTVRQALAESETPRQRAVRLAAVASARDGEDAQRIAFLGRACEADDEVGRRTALELVRDPSLAVRRASADVLARTRGSEDDLPQLLSLVARERDDAVRELLQVSIDALAVTDLGESLTALMHLLEVPNVPRQLDLDRLIPDLVLRPRFCRWADKVVARTAHAKRPAAVIAAAATLSALLVDIALISAFTSGDATELTEVEVDQIRHDLNGRPRLAALASRPASRTQFPWLLRSAELGELNATVAQQPAFLATDDDAATALRLLTEVTEGWLTAMHTH